jgi:hypothetical protein
VLGTVDAELKIWRARKDLKINSNTSAVWPMGKVEAWRLFSPRDPDASKDAGPLAQEKSKAWRLGYRSAARLQLLPNPPSELAKCALNLSVYGFGIALVASG